VVAGDRQHIPDPSAFQVGAQPGIVAVDFVTGDPGGRDSRVQLLGTYNSRSMTAWPLRAAYTR
jgi:hypothetical protein